LKKGEKEKKEKSVDIQKTEGGELLREVTVKIELERIDTQKGIIVEAFLDSRTIGLVMSLEFTRKKGFKLKKIKRLIYMRNVDRKFNKKRLIFIIKDIGRK